MWLDVEKGRDTTDFAKIEIFLLLWLDVEKGRDTTYGWSSHQPARLWLDVEKGRDTTGTGTNGSTGSCGLM